MRNGNRMLGVALAVGFAAWCFPASSGADDLLGKKAPDFKLTDCEGNETTLGQFAGKVIVLNFWRTTCFPCLEEMPEIEALHEAYQDKGVVVIGVAVNDNLGDVQNKIDVLRIRYPVVRDDMATRLKYQIKSVPHTFIIDKKGIIRHHFDTQTEKKALEDAIKPLIEEKPAQAE